MTKKVLWLLPFLCFAIPAIVSVFYPPLFLYPNNNDISMGIYDDSESGGNSSITQSQGANGQLQLNYILGDAFPYPYAGLFMHINKNGTARDISSFSQLRLKIESETTQTIKVIVTAKQKLLSLPYEYEILIEKGRKVYFLALDDLLLPEWWLTENKLTVYELPERDFSQVTDIDIANGAVHQLNTKVSIDIYEIALVSDFSFLYLPIAMLVSIFYLTFLIKYFFKKSNEQLSKTVKQSIIPYNPLQLESFSDINTRELVAYISANYHDPELTVSKVSEGANIPKAKIPQIIKAEFNYSFPQYLNLIRLTEAKRLLENTDLQVIEIALSVGFNNVTHFNRTFKKIENISPKQFRTQLNKNCK